MPKGIRKACANCIKARLACDDGRPCQRCIVHQCECVPVARKPRVKKQKIESPASSPEKNEMVVISWVQSDQSSFADQKSIDYNAGSPPTPLTPQTPSPQPSLPASPQIDASPQQTPTSIPVFLPQHPTPSQFVPSSPAQSDLLPDLVPRAVCDSPLSPTHMLSLLLEEKPSDLLQDWPEMPQFGSFVNDFYIDDACCKKASAPAPLPQPKNSTPLFPTPIGVFDKQKFRLLDANAALANLFGCTTVAEFASTVTNLDDLVDPAAAHIAKHADTYFLPSLPYDRIGVLHVRNGSKTVEFRVELTEQLLIFTVKSVFDDCFMPLPEIQMPPQPIPCDAAQYKAFEFLAPID